MSKSDAKAAWAYYIGVGSNVEPKKNVPAIIERLLIDFKQLILSRLCYTAPVGIISDNIFVNFVVYVESELTPDLVKAYFNQVEADFGRDRSDPERKRRDRRADLDIIFAAPLESKPVSSEILSLCDEDFILPMLHEVLDFQRGEDVKPASFPVLEFQLGELRLGEVPTAVDLDASAGHKGIIQD